MCGICNRHYYSEIELEEHIFTHEETDNINDHSVADNDEENAKQKLTCGICKIIFSSEMTMKRHYRYSHTPFPDISEADLLRTVVQESQIKRHMMKSSCILSLLFGLERDSINVVRVISSFGIYTLLKYAYLPDTPSMSVVYVKLYYGTDIRLNVICWCTKVKVPRPRSVAKLSFLNTY